MRRLTLLLLVVPCLGRAEPNPAESARLAVERILRAEADVLGEVEAVERRARKTKAELTLAESELAAATRALEEASREEAEAAAKLSTRLAALSPRLRARYRMLRAGSLGALLAADSPAELVRRSAALDRLLRADLEALEAARIAQAAHRTARTAAEEARAAVAARTEGARTAASVASTAAEARAALLASLREEKRLRERVLRSVEVAQERLTQELARLGKDAAPLTGFAALRGTLALPVQGGVVEVPFGKVINPKFNTITFHKGIDLRARAGSEIRAIAPGRVVHAGWFGGYGTLVIVDHGDNYHSLYAHLEEAACAVGDEVDSGELLGVVGDTGSLKGAYLYFEIREQGRPVDPRDWIGAARR